MNKKKSIVVLCIVSVFIILMAVFAVVSFPIAGTVYDYTGYAKTIKLGLDMSGGVSAVFRVANDDYGDFDTRINGTISSLQSLLVSKGYTEATVTKGTSSDGNTTIRVEIPDVDDPARVLELVGRPASLYFTLKDLGNEASNADLEKEAFLNGREHLENAYVTTSDNGNYAIGLKFNTEGAKIFGEITSANVGKKTYIYVGGQKIMEPSINAAITNGSAIITGNYTYQSAYEYATKLQSGTFGVTLQLAEVRSISATLGENSIRTALIAGIIGVALIFIFMACVYRGLGLAADLLALRVHRVAHLVLRSAPVGATHTPRYCGYLAFNRYGSRRKRHHIRESQGRIQTFHKAHFNLHQGRFQTLCGRNHRRSGYDAHRRNRALGARLCVNRRLCRDTLHRYHSFLVLLARRDKIGAQSVYAAQQHKREVLRFETRQRGREQRFRSCTTCKGGGVI